MSKPSIAFGGPDPADISHSHATRQKPNAGPGLRRPQHATRSNPPSVAKALALPIHHCSITHSRQTVFSLFYVTNSGWTGSCFSLKGTPTKKIVKNTGSFFSCQQLRTRHASYKIGTGLLALYPITTHKDFAWRSLLKGATTLHDLGSWNVRKLFYDKMHRPTTVKYTC